jgi:RNA polymerase sigma-70 factor (ECF subfamily)
MSSQALPDFQTLQNRYFRSLHVYASMLGVRSETDREDLAHDALVRAYLSLDRYDRTKPLTPWIYAIARNAIIDTLRARKGEPVPMDTLEEYPAGGDVEESVLANDRISRVRSEIMRMGERDREIAMLVFFESLTAAETGRILGIPGATVRWRVAEIRKRLRRSCGEET